jgi:predicted transcriptional regulator
MRKKLRYLTNRRYTVKGRIAGVVFQQPQAETIREWRKIGDAVKECISPLEMEGLKPLLKI